MDATLTDDESLVGEACHIIARELDGPRGTSSLTEIERDKFANLVLLCNLHHKQVDDQIGEFTVERLHAIKIEHEKWVRQKLGPDLAQQRDDETYAGYLDEWETRVSLDKWSSWASWTFSAGQPRIGKVVDDQLSGLRDWLLGRVWPRRYLELEAAFTNFRVVCADYQNMFHEEVDDWGETLAVSKFYKTRDYDDTRFNHLVDVYEAHCALIECLMLELTRSANLICDLVRKSFLPNYRLREGVCLVSAGPFMPDLSYRTYRVEYRGNESGTKYPGLTKFLDVRFERDIWFGDKKDNELIRKHGPAAGKFMSFD